MKKQADEFVENIKKEISIIGPDNVYNTDQSGFNLEMHAERTLAFVRTLKVESLAQSINSLTHSYTIQPIITASGLLKSPLLIVTQEKGGCFGPIFEKTLYKAENIVTFASQSGKLSSKLAVQWFQDIFLIRALANDIFCALILGQDKRKKILKMLRNMVRTLQ